MPEITNAQQLFDIIKPIPKSKFITGMYCNENKTKCCFLGHINVSFGEDPRENTSGHGARDITRRYLADKNITDSTIGWVDGVNINDTPHINGFNESNPKDRVMHLIKDMIRDGY